MKRKIYGNELNFLTLTVVDWINVFTRRTYNDFIIDNISYCRKNKGLQVYAYVLMTNHLHLIVRSKEENLSDIIRYFKTFTSKELVNMIKTNLEESRRLWMLEIFSRHGKQNERNKKYQFWQNGNYPIALFSNKVIKQKIDYIHANPIRAGLVDRADKYYYSSANPFSPLKMDE